MHRKTIAALAALVAGLTLAAGGCGPSGPATPQSTVIPGCTGPDHHESPCPHKVAVG